MAELEDPIRKLLEQSGWSYTEVLKKLENYKVLCVDGKNASDNRENDDSACEPKTNYNNNDTTVKLSENDLQENNLNEMVNRLEKQNLKPNVLENQETTATSEFNNIKTCDTNLKTHVNGNLTEDSMKHNCDKESHKIATVAENNVITKNEVKKSLLEEAAEHAENMKNDDRDKTSNTQKVVSLCTNKTDTEQKQSKPNNKECKHPSKIIDQIQDHITPESVVNISKCKSDNSLDLEKIPAVVPKFKNCAFNDCDSGLNHMITFNESNPSILDDTKAQKSETATRNTNIKIPNKSCNNVEDAIKMKPNENEDCSTSLVDSNTNLQNVLNELETNASEVANIKPKVSSCQTSTSLTESNHEISHSSITNRDLKFHCDSKKKEIETRHKKILEAFYSRTSKIIKNYESGYDIFRLQILRKYKNLQTQKFGKRRQLADKLLKQLKCTESLKNQINLTNSRPECEKDIQNSKSVPFENVEIIDKEYEVSNKDVSSDGITSQNKSISEMTSQKFLLNSNNHIFEIPKSIDISDFGNDENQKLEDDNAKLNSPFISSVPLLRKKKNGRLASITDVLFKKLGCKTNSDLTSDEDAPKLTASVDPLNEVLLSNDSNESNLQIISVIGGYESPEHESKSEEHDVELNDQTEFPYNVEGTAAYGIRPTKTNDVTKIKGWKKKNFAVTRVVQKSAKESSTVQDLPASSKNTVYPTLLQQILTSQPQENAYEKVPLLNIESQSSKESTSTENNSKSAFVSDVLDQYLTQHSELNISYEVPSLNAEKTITKKYIDIKFPEVSAYKPRQPIKKSDGTYKPKTLAEKRRMLREAQEKSIRDCTFVTDTTEQIKFEDRVSGVRNKLIEENVPFTKRCFSVSTAITNKESFIIYNGRKYRVASTKPNSIITKISANKRVYKTLRKIQQYKKMLEKTPKKKTLLHGLKAKHKYFRFNPNEWKEVTRNLPKLYLELIPRLGKRIHPKIEHLITSNNDYLLTKDRVDFALSALRDREAGQNVKKFTFPLRYKHNQREIKLKKQKILPPSAFQNVKISETDDEILEAVSGMVNKMLDYVEISEEATTSIREDSLTAPDEKVIIPAVSVLDKSPKGFKPKGHQSKAVDKTTLEMRRLNCKIVSVSLEEENALEHPCTKEFCKLGCVCNSIECKATGLLPTHCGLVECMFKCNCKMKQVNMQNVSLPAGTDVFSEGVISRLQDEAKKNLAKEEKEFTQMAIKTNNGIIIVGDSKERRRRATKLPKKYHDYVDDDLEIPPKLTMPIKHHINTIRQSLIENCLNTTCSVKLDKLNLDSLIPYCMVHRLYKCHCNYKAVYVELPKSAKPASHPQKIVTAPFAKVNSAVKNKYSECEEVPCSRTTGLSSNFYLQRNKLQFHKNKIKRSTATLKVELDIFLQENASKYLNSKELIAISNASDISTIPESSSSQQLRPPPPLIACTSNGIKRKRKQCLTVLPDRDSDIIFPDSNQRDSTALTRKSPQTATPVMEKGRKYASIIPKPIIELEKNLNNVDKQFRLLPWSTLATHFQNDKFQLWYACSSIKAGQLLITENGKQPTSRHINIKSFEYVTEGNTIPAEIVRCLINKSVPMGKVANEILLMLYFKTHWEVCGICEKKPNSDLEQKNSVSISLIENSSSSCNNLPGDDLILIGKTAENKSAGVTVEGRSANVTAEDKSANIAAEDKNANVTAEDKSTNVAAGDKSENISNSKIVPTTIMREVDFYKNGQNLQNQKIMYSSKKKFQLKQLISYNESETKRVIWVSLPKISHTCKWRALDLTENFAYLSLFNSSYTIRYRDIFKTINIAKTEKVTVSLRSNELAKSYKHPSFGVYCVHNYSNKIFIGPYRLYEDDDLNAYNYVDNVLVHVNLANSNKNQTLPESGEWYRPTVPQDFAQNEDDDVLLLNPLATTIDLTCDSDEETSLNKELDNSNKILQASVPLQNLQETPPNKTKSIQNTSDENGNTTTHITIDENTKTDKEQFLPLFEKSKIKKYIISNVPSMGYILGYWSPDSLKMDVVCPITQKRKEFPSQEAVARGLERILTKKFLWLPDNFKLKITIVDKLENPMFPLDRTVLNGFHIIGKFGVKDTTRINANKLSKLRLESGTIAHILEKRDEKMVIPALRNLEKILNISSNLSSSVDDAIGEAIKMTTSEISKLHAKNASYIAEKILLESTKVSLVQKCSELISKFPETHQNRYKKTLDNIINENSNSGNVAQKEDKGQATDVITLDEDSEIFNTKTTAEVSNAIDTKTSVDTNKPTKAQLYPTMTNLLTRNVVVTNTTSTLPTEKLNLTGSSKNKLVLLTQKCNKNNQKPASNAITLSKLPLQVLRNVSVAAKKPASLTQTQRLKQKNVLSAASSIPSLLKISDRPLVTQITSTEKAPCGPVILPNVTSNTRTIVPGAKIPLVYVPVNVVQMVSTTSNSTLLQPVVSKTTSNTTTPNIVSNSNYVTVKEGSSVKCYQVISDSNNITPAVQSTSALKRRGSSLLVQPPSKKLSISKIEKS